MGAPDRAPAVDRGRGRVLGPALIIAPVTGLKIGQSGTNSLPRGPAFTVLQQLAPAASMTVSLPRSRS